MKTLKIDNEIRDLIPKPTQEEIELLEQNILKDGIREPLCVWGGTLIDGHNRYEIAVRHGLEFDVKELDFVDRSDVIIWIIKNQFGRRNLSSYTRGVLALRMEEEISKKAKENLSKAGQGSQISVKVDTQKEVAKAANVSHDTIYKIKKIEANADDRTKEKLSKGEVTINSAYKDIVREEKKAEHSKKIERVRLEPKNNIAGPYDLVLADPPWRYDHQEAANRDIENHYPTATVEEIISHKPETNKDAILLLWATAPKLKEGIEVLEGWGFQYKTHAIWDKKLVGMGYWFRGQHELLLVGVKGNPSATPESERVSSVFSEERGRHSKKPQCVYEWIERAFPEQKKIEMYCREVRIGWGTWGNEV